jgi:hypothetical protein
VATSRCSPVARRTRLTSWPGCTWLRRETACGPVPDKRTQGPNTATSCVVASDVDATGGDVRITAGVRLGARQRLALPCDPADVLRPFYWPRGGSGQHPSMTRLCYAGPIHHFVHPS